MMRRRCWLTFSCRRLVQPGTEGQRWRFRARLSQMRAFYDAKLRHSAPRPIFTMQNGGSQVAIVGVRLLMF